MPSLKSRFSSTVPYELKDGDFISYIEELHSLMLEQRKAQSPLPLIAESPQDSFEKMRKQHQKTMAAIKQHATARPQPKVNPTTITTKQNSGINSSSSPRTAQGSSAQVFTKAPPRSLTKEERRKLEQELRKANSLQGATTVFGLFALSVLLAGDLYFPGNLILAIFFVFAMCGFAFAIFRRQSIRKKLNP